MLAALLAPAEAGTTFEIILEGDSDAERRGDRQPVAISSCTYRFHDDASLEECINILRESDAALAANPARQYDWQQSMVTRFPDGGGLIIFGVSWYDEAFFTERRDIFSGHMHRQIYERLGITDADITVHHWRAA